MKFHKMITYMWILQICATAVSIFWVIPVSAFMNEPVMLTIIITIFNLWTIWNFNPLFWEYVDKAREWFDNHKK